MTDYAIGDIQGCYRQFLELLRAIDFDTQQDFLWIAGDLINRGPDNLATLRYIYHLQDRAKIVLGNHDLHLLAVFYGAQPLREDDTFGDILQAPDADSLINWLRTQPVLQRDTSQDIVMTHAGIPPQWDIPKAQQLAAELEEVLRDDTRILDFLKQLHDPAPRQWRDDLTDMERLLSIAHYFTRMRFCSPQGELDLKNALVPDRAPRHMAPWYSHPRALPAQTRVLFGHWAALQGFTGFAHSIALDTGCVWGKCLTAFNITTQEKIQIDCGWSQRK